MRHMQILLIRMFRSADHRAKIRIALPRTIPESYRGEQNLCTFSFFFFFFCLLHLRVRTILVSRSVFSGSLLMFMLDLNFSQKLFEFKEHSNDCSLSLCVFALYLRVDQHHCYFNTIFTIPLVCHTIKLSRNSKE